MKVITLLSCTTISIAILLLAIFVPSFLFEKSSVYGQQDTTTTNKTTTIGSKIPYYIFPTEIEE